MILKVIEVGIKITSIDLIELLMIDEGEHCPYCDADHVSFGVINTETRKFCYECMTIITKESKEERVERIAKDYHEICREMVNSGIGMITKPTQPYIEWKDLTENQKDGRRFIAKKLIDKYNIN